uniref:Uncharacterized protein n=1 Tax=Timema shepardi TaxID=629360 RepID=A0A7R9B519_TIMSH|nr:unnamed protein product [Timema shepardi]
MKGTGYNYLKIGIGYNEGDWIELAQGLTGWSQEAQVSEKVSLAVRMATLSNQRQRQILKRFRDRFHVAATIRSPLFLMEVATLAFVSQPEARTLDTCVGLLASS